MLEEGWWPWVDGTCAVARLQLSPASADHRVVWAASPSASVSHLCIGALALPPSLGYCELSELSRVKCLQQNLARGKYLETLSCHS